MINKKTSFSDKISHKYNEVYKDIENETNTKILSWWNSDFIIRHINKFVCGEECEGRSQGLIKLLKERSGGQVYDMAISVGVGTGIKEMKLITDGIVGKFVMFEFSDVAISIGKRMAKNMGIADKCEFIKGDCFKANIAEGSFDLIHWNDSLHHMFDVDYAVRWSYEILKNGGMFYMDDYVGPSRFQWSEANLKIASLVRSILGEKYLKDPMNPKLRLNSRIHRPSIKSIIYSDPSEAVQSHMIMSCVRKYFTDAEIRMTGGALYHLALSGGVLNNFNLDIAEDMNVLKLILMLDELCIYNLEIGTHYATALALKKT